MNNVIMRKITLTEEYQPLFANRLVASVEISAPPSNSGTAYFLGDDGTDVPWTQGEWHSFSRIDLSSFSAKGTAGDVLTIVGGTW